MAAAGKKKSKTGLMIGLVLLIVFIAAGAVAGLAMAGKINIPGLTPKKKPAPAPAKPKAKPKKLVAPPKDEVVVDKKVPVTLDKQGAAKLATVWNEMPAAKLNKVVTKWKPADLALVLNEMDTTKAAELLATMDPAKASTTSQELKKIASLALPAEQ